MVNIYVITNKGISIPTSVFKTPNHTGSSYPTFIYLVQLYTFTWLAHSCKIPHLDYFSFTFQHRLYTNDARQLRVFSLFRSLGAVISVVRTSTDIVNIRQSTPFLYVFHISLFPGQGQCYHVATNNRLLLQSQCSNNNFGLGHGLWKKTSTHRQYYWS